MVLPRKTVSLYAVSRYDSCHNRNNPGCPSDSEVLFSALKNTISTTGITIIAEPVCDTDWQGTTTCALKLLFPTDLSLFPFVGEDGEYFIFTVNDEGIENSVVDWLKDVELKLIAELDVIKAAEMAKAQAVRGEDNIKELLVKSEELAQLLRQWMSPDFQKMSRDNEDASLRPHSPQPGCSVESARDMVHEQSMDHICKRLEGFSLDDSMLDKLNAEFVGFYQKFKDECSLEGSAKLTRELDRMEL